MNRNFGLSTGILALFALFVHVAGPGSEKTESGSSAAYTNKNDDGEKRKSKINATSANSNPVAPEIEGPWLATQSYFGLPGQNETQSDVSQGKAPVDFGNPADILNRARHKELLPDIARPFRIADFQRVQFIIATVPDPFHTHLALFTDSSIRAIEQGAAATGWEPASQWLPWKDLPDSEEKDPVLRREERNALRAQESQPGVLVFRRRVADPELEDQRVLLIFLVGEDPVGGVNRVQFEIARAYMRAIHDATPIRILGPTFSGSFQSLAHLIRADKQNDHGREYSVVTGTATVVKSGKYLQNEVGHESFHSTAITGDQESDAFRALVQMLGIETRHAALLDEDESDYGLAVTTPTTDDFRRFQFPRDISHLRNAYHETTQSAQSQAQGPKLDFSIKDKETGEDGVATFSIAQTPISQSGIINEISRKIVRERIRIVKVSATNVLDLLFLARLLRRQCPNTRVVLSYPDVLFVEAAQTEGLTGLLALSRYPTSDPMHSNPTLHPDPNSEGVFNATVLLLDSDGAAPAFPDGHLRGSLLPRTWLLTLDREGFIPLLKWKESYPFGWSWAPLPETQPPVVSQPRIWYVVRNTLAILSIGLVGWIACLFLIPRLLVDARFAFRARTNLDQWRIFYLCICLLTLTFLQLVVLIPAWRGGSVNLWLFYLLDVPGIALPLLVVLVAITRSHFFGCKLRSLAMSFVLAGFAGSILIWFLSCSTAETGLFFSNRSVELRPGSSPIWPILPCAVALLIFTFLQATRIYSVVYQKPNIVAAPELEERFRDSKRNFDNSLKSVLALWDLSQKKWFVAVVVACLCACALCRVDVHLQPVDSPYFRWLLLALQLGLAGMILLTCWQATVLWMSLHSCLSSLETTPLTRSFVQPNAGSGNQPIWVRRFNLQSLDVHNRASIMLSDLSLLLAAEPSLNKAVLRHVRSWSTTYDDRICTLANPLNSNGTRKTRSDLLEQFRLLRRRSTLISAAILKELCAFWKSQPRAGTVDFGSKLSEGLPPVIETPTTARQLAETFVALHFTSFLLYAVNQIKNVLWFLPIGFVLLLISLSSYPLQSPQLISRFLILFFVFIALVVWRALSGMERDPILSRISGTRAGVLESGFYFKIIGYGALPVLGLLASEFPSISNFLFSWVAPSLAALR